MSVHTLVELSREMNIPHGRTDRLVPSYWELLFVLLHYHVVLVTVLNNYVVYW